MTASADFAWVDDVLPAAFSLAVVVGSAPGEILLAVCGGASLHGSLTLDEAGTLWAELLEQDEGNSAPLIQLLPVHDAVFLLQPNGFFGEQLARSLSGRGRAVTFSCSINADMQVVVAEEGAVVREFDPLLYDADGALAEEAGLGFGDDEVSSAAAVFAFIARLGLPVPSDAQLSEPLPTYVA